MSLAKSLVSISVALTFCAPLSCGAATDSTKAEANRKKPLQRCDQLKDKAELECLQKARERVVEARKKRESDENRAAEKGGKSEDKSSRKP